MDSKQREEKLKLWKKQAADLEKQLGITMVKRGVAAQEGDLKENAAYLDLNEQAEVISSRLGLIQKMIRDLEKESI